MTDVRRSSAVLKPLAPETKGSQEDGADPDIPEPLCRYTLCQEAQRRWMVIDRIAQNGGIFTSREAAIQFIRLDCCDARPIREVHAALVFVANGPSLVSAALKSR